MGFVMASKEERSCEQGGYFRSSSRHSAPRWELPNVARAIVAGGWRCGSWVRGGDFQPIEAWTAARIVLGMWECGPPWPSCSRADEGS